MCIARLLTGLGRKHVAFGIRHQIPLVVTIEFTFNVPSDTWNRINLNSSCMCRMIDIQYIEVNVFNILHRYIPAMLKTGTTSPGTKILQYVLMQNAF
jgi:hypothetical protein